MKIWKYTAFLLLLVAIGAAFFACNKRNNDEEAGIEIRFVTGYESDGVIVPTAYATETKPAQLPVDPVYLGSGLIFDGWYYDEARTDEFDSKRALTESVVLYAKWRDNGSSQSGKPDDDGTIVDVEGIRYVKLSDTEYAVSGYEGKEETVSIPSTVKGVFVTTILGNAFRGADTVRYVNIPSTVTTITAGAFGGASKLENIYVHKDNKVYTEKNGVLYAAGGETLVAVGRAKKSFSLPVKVKEIEKYAFAGCSFELTFGSGAFHTIGEYAFADFAGKITLGAQITYVQYRAFYGATCEIVFAEDCGLQKLGMGEFDGYAGERLVLPASIESISGAPFAGSAAAIDFSATGIKVLGESAFAWYKGETLVLPYFVESTKNNCFYQCSSRVTFDERTTYATVGEYAFNRFEGEVTFPSTVRTVEAYAFYAMKHGKAHFSAAKSDLTIAPTAFTACYTPNVTYGG